MKKQIKLFSSVLTLGLLLGSAAPVAASAQRSAPTTRSTSQVKNSDPQEVTSVTLEDNDVTVDEETGRITDFTDSTKAKALSEGAELIIPETLDGITITGISDRPANSSDGVFDNDRMTDLAGLDQDGPGISKVTFKGLLNIDYIGSYAFYDNQLTDISLPNVSTIGYSAFSSNQLTDISLPNVSTIDNHAFTENQLTDISLPSVSTIGEYAFMENQLTDISLPNVSTIGEYAFQDNQLTNIKLPTGTNLEEGAFTNQNISHPVMASAEGEIAFDDLQPKLMIDDKNKIPQISDVTVDNSEYPLTVEDGKITNATQETPFKANLELSFDEELPSYYSINSYELIINPFEDNDNGGDNNNGNNGSGGDNSGGSTGTEAQPDNNTSGSDNNTEVQPLPDPDKEAPAPYSVYALRGMRLHKNVSLTDPVRSYKKQARAKAANFRIEGVAYDQNGKKRYKVKGGYITASSKYVADSHFRSKKINRVRVISNKANSYKDLKLSKNQKVRSYKKGTKLNVKRIVNYGRTTRFELTNGRYISGNKQIFIMDQK